MADIFNPVNTNPHLINKNDYILIFADNLSLSDITTGGLTFIILFIVTYFLLIIWACFKDKQKQVYSQRVASGQNVSQATMAMPRRTNFRAVNIDITSDTLDFTNQSVRVNFDDQKDLSALFQNTHNDVQATISPMHRTEGLSLTSPQNVDGKKPKFNMMRTPHRGPQKIDLESTVGPASTGNDDDVITGKDETVGTKEDTIKENETLAKEINNMIEDMSRDDESMYRTNSNKKEPKRKAKERSSSIKVTNKARQGIKSKFMKLMGQRHILISTVKRMSRISPRYKRVSLITFLLACDLFGMTLSFIDFSVFENAILQIVKISIGTWILFAAISWLSSVSKDPLKSAKSNDDFMRILVALEKEAHYKDIAVHFIIGLFVACALTQFGLFFVAKEEFVVKWLMYGFSAFLIQVVILDSIWLLIIAIVYIRAYDSQAIRRLYRTLNSVRFWKI